MIGPKKNAVPPMKVDEQHDARTRSRRRSAEFDDLEIDRGQAAGDAGEEPGEAEGDVAHDAACRSR